MDYVIENRYGVITVRDRETMDEPKSIRFITPRYEELFTIPDGGNVILRHVDGYRELVQCQYLDDYHLLFGGIAYHICELAEKLCERGQSVSPCPSRL